MKKLFIFFMFILTLVFLPTLKINAETTDPSSIIDYLDYDLSQEEWKTFRDTIYMVSNLGRVKNVKTNKLLKGKITSSGYREYCLTFNNKKQSFRGHKLTWEVWNGYEQNIINHINGNKLDNRITNLENVTNKENTLKAIYETKTFQFKKTACYDKEGNLKNGRVTKITPKGMKYFYRKLSAKKIVSA